MSNQENRFNLELAKAKIWKINRKIIEACRRKSRNPSDIVILAATKNKAVLEINTLIQAGIKLIGENRVQEAQRKFESKELLTCKRHFIGRLQKNKVGKAVRLFDCIQSVDSVELGEIINRRAQEIGKVQQIFLQVNSNNDPAKTGFTCEQTEKVLTHLQTMKNITVTGLMTIGKQTQDTDEKRHYFTTLRQLFNAQSKNYPLTHLSMGMSQDYVIAIEEGSTMVRLGKLLFENE